MAWYNTDWQYRKSITINSSEVDTTLTDYPAYIEITGDSDISAEAQSSGDDILFTADDGSTKLDHEIQGYDNSTGDLHSHVQISSLSDASDTQIYIYYGNSGASNQENATGVWGSDFVSVHHLQQSASGTGNTGIYEDATAANHHGDDEVSATNNDGQVYQGQSFDGSDDYISVPYSSDFDLTTFSLSCWFRTSGGSDQILTLTQKQDPDDQHADRNWWIAIDNGQGFAGGDGYIGLRTSSGAEQPSIEAENDYIDGEWHHVFCVFDPGNDNAEVWVDGILEGSQTGVGEPDTQSSDVVFGSQDKNDRFFEGNIDEHLLYNDAKPSGYITTLYSNQDDPSSFITVGSEESAIETATLSEMVSSVTDFQLLGDAVPLPLIQTAPDFNVAKDQTQNTGVIGNFISSAEQTVTRVIESVVGTIGSADRGDEDLTPPQLNFGVTKDQRHAYSVLDEFGSVVDRALRTISQASTIGTSIDRHSITSKVSNQVSSIVITVATLSVFLNVIQQRVSITPNAATPAAFSLSRSETVDPIETVVNRSRFLRTLDEVVSIVEAVTNNVFVERVFAEMIGGIENVQDATVSKFLSEVQDIRDESDRSAFYERVFLEPVANIEALSSLGITKSVESISGVVDTFNSVAGLFKSALATQVVGVDDTIERAGDLVRSYSKNVGIVHQVAVPVLFTRVHDEIVSISSEIDFVKDLVRVMYQPIGLVEQNFPIPEELERLVIETRVAVRDQYERVFDGVRTFDETIQTQDLTRVRPQIVASQVVGVFGALLYSIRYSRVFDEIVDIEDQLISTLFALRSIAVSLQIGIHDTVVEKVGFVREQLEVVSVSEDSNFVQDLVRVMYQPVGVVEQNIQIPEELERLVLEVRVAMEIEFDRILDLSRRFSVVEGVEETEVNGLVKVLSEVESATTEIINQVRAGLLEVVGPIETFDHTGDFTRVFDEVVDIGHTFVSPLLQFRTAALAVRVGVREEFERQVDFVRAYVERASIHERGIVRSRFREVLEEAIGLVADVRKVPAVYRSQVIDPIGNIDAPINFARVFSEPVTLIDQSRQKLFAFEIAVVSSIIGVRDRFEYIGTFHKILDEVVDIGHQFFSPSLDLRTTVVSARVGIAEEFDRTLDLIRTHAEVVTIADTVAAGVSLEEVLEEIGGVIEESRRRVSKVELEVVGQVEAFDYIGSFSRVFTETSLIVSSVESTLAALQTMVMEAIVGVRRVTEKKVEFQRSYAETVGISYDTSLSPVVRVVLEGLVSVRERTEQSVDYSRRMVANIGIVDTLIGLAGERLIREVERTLEWAASLTRSVAWNDTTSRTIGWNETVGPIVDPDQIVSRTLGWNQRIQRTVQFNPDMVEQIAPDRRYSSGETVVWEYTVEEDGSPFDLTGADVEWYLVPNQGDNNSVAAIDHTSSTVTASVVTPEADGRIDIEVESSATEDIDGEYWQRLIVDKGGDIQKWGGPFPIEEP